MRIELPAPTWADAQRAQDDAHTLTLQLHVSDEVLAQRRAAWTPPAPRYTRGVMAKFFKNAASASQGAVLDKID